MATILIVDDAEASRVQLRLSLEKGGHKILEANNGQVGIDVLKENLTEVKLIISDYNMPVMNGMAMCQVIWQEFQQHKIPVVMLTTETSPSIKARAKEVGIIAWMIKPFKEEVLLKGVEKIVGSK